MQKTSLIRSRAVSVFGVPVACLFLTMGGGNTPLSAMNIAFVGDSITQGGSFLSGSVASYRYSLFKNFVDAGVVYTPMGMTSGASKNVDVSALTPDYRGFVFSNVSESAASARTYQFGGHAAGSAYKSDPATAYPEANRGPVSVKLGIENPYTGTTNTFYDGSTLKTYSGDTYGSLYGKAKVDTLCVMIGINDLYDGRGNEVTANHVKDIVNAYQRYNPNIDVFVFEVLPTGKNNGTGTTKKNNYASYNEYLRGVAGTWSTETSKVSVCNVSTGFYAESGAMIDTVSGAHPNAQGELIVAGNIARVLGIAQRTAGLERRAQANLASQATFSATATGGIAVKTQLAGEEKTFVQTGTGFSLNAEGNLVMNTTKTNGHDFRLSWNGSGTASELTVALSLKMTETKSSENRFCSIIGNGATAGLLYVSECGIFWDSKLLYGSDTLSDVTHNTFSATEDFVDLTVAYLDGSNGVAAGFYVWLFDQLIGEALSSVGSVVSHKDKVLFGDLGGAWLTQCELRALSFDFEKALAPSAIPEPSSAGLFAGTAALFFVVSRRRRRK